MTVCKDISEEWRNLKDSVFRTAEEVMGRSIRVKRNRWFDLGCGWDNKEEEEVQNQTVEDRKYGRLKTVIK